ncbi:MAG: outer membrane protein transport protein [Gammaproteobacteria bacterium]|nr:outer membrane protein transport protein [Gammaproteobacteria bacterium]
MKNKNLAKSILLASLMGCYQYSYATNGYQLIGIGSYQKGLAGAVTASPGSAMTAITNPAGMARIGKRADFSLEMFMPDRHVDFSSMGGERNDSEATQYGVPALGWSAPVDDGSDIYFGGGIYGTSGLGTDYPLTQYAAATPAPSPDMYFEGYSSLQFWQMAPTLAWNVDKKLSLGASLNIDYQSVSLRQAFIADTTADGIADTKMANLDLSRTAQSFGFGFTLGALYDINDQITVGASYKSKQQFSDMKYQLSNGDIMDATGQLQISGCPVNPGPPATVICPAGTYSLELDFPEMISAGIAYKPVQQLTLSLDIKMIQWSDTLNVLKITGPGGMTLTMPAGWNDQTIIAVGVNYAVTDKFNLRAGYNQSDAPIKNADTDSNYILPAVTTTHFAFGGDYHLSKYWELGFHVSKAQDETLASPGTGAKIGLGITTLGINIGYHF